MRDPWAIADVERLLAAARTMPGDVAGIRAGKWWTAFLLVQLDVPVKVHQVLGLPRSAYDHAAGTIAIPPLVYGVHALTVEALDAIRRHEAERLFPWPLDRGRVHTMLFRRFRELLFRAGLPHVRRNLFERLRATAEAHPDVLDRVDPHRSIDVRPRAPKIDRGKRADHAATSRRRMLVQARRDEAAVYLIDDGSPRTLRNLFRLEYEPRRLANGSEHTPGGFLASITRLSAFLGCEASIDQLSDELLERFAAWDLQTRSPATVAAHLRHLRVLWRFAWRRRFVDDAPRDNDSPKMERRLPEAWSTHEMGRIFDAAAEQTGAIADVPAGDWWLAFLGTLYETGLRVRATLALEADAFEPLTRDVTVPAAVQKQKVEQTFRLSEETAALVERLPDGGPLFPRPAWKSPATQLRRRYRRILQAAGLPHGPRDLFHKLRRTHATFVADAFDEHEACRQLGHSSVQLTKRNYIDVRKLRKRVHAADALPKPTRRHRAG